MSKKMFLDSTDVSDVYDDVSEKKAVPELILKANILQAEDKMLLSERVMMSNFRLRKSFILNDEIVFAGDIILLWGFIKHMIIDYGLKSDVDKRLFMSMCELENGKYFSGRSLIVLKNFLLKYLHLLNITNLFVSRGGSWKSEIDDDLK